MIARIDKVLADSGAATRSQARIIIRKGGVCVDGAVITKPEYKIDTDKNKVTVDGREIVYSEFSYIMLNKPKGVVSAVTDKKYKTVIDLIDKKDLKKDMFPVGRLDIDTVGLLIITNDGKTAHENLSPKKHVVKRYYTEVRGKLTLEDVRFFEEGIVIDGKALKGAGLEIVESGEISKCYVEIAEGKFHQIKRMFQKCGKEVVYLKRVKFGDLMLDENLKEGEYRFLSATETAIFLRR